MEVWDLYFSAVASLRFHPRNEVSDRESELRYAAEIADLMLKIRNEKWPLQQP